MKKITILLLAFLVLLPVVSFAGTGTYTFTLTAVISAPATPNLRVLVGRSTLARDTGLQGRVGDKLQGCVWNSTQNYTLTNTQTLTFVAPCVIIQVDQDTKVFKQGDSVNYAIIPSGINFPIIIPD